MKFINLVIAQNRYQFSAYFNAELFPRDSIMATHNDQFRGVHGKIWFIEYPGYNTFNAIINFVLKSGKFSIEYLDKEI